ncbi:unnamed protein product [Lactuca saligna]|uniref:Uncharacterized protein n=1 Tax=Lactuca saligna TaxID=75948 RepID=A0AA35VGG7_LACSI|nr:unnamed protein product [Lactuca saligna]
MMVVMRPDLITFLKQEQLSTFVIECIVVKKGDSDIGMVVDACCPHDIREETDPEYFYRHIPLNRINGDAHCSFPSFSAAYEDIKEGDSSSTTFIEC